MAITNELINVQRRSAKRSVIAAGQERRSEFSFFWSMIQNLRLALEVP